MRYQLREGARAPKDEDRSSRREKHIVAHEKITSNPNSVSVNRSRYEPRPPKNTSHNTTIETTTSKQNGLLHSPLGNVPPEMRLAIMQLSLQSVQKIAIAPKGMTTPKDHNNLPAKTSNESSSSSSLVFTTRHPLANSCRQLRAEYTNELKSRVFARKIPTLHLHVIDFDFSLVVRELLSHFTAAHREYFNARAHSIRIYLTITDAFTRVSDDEGGVVAWLERKQSDEGGLKQWLEWREAEESAGRKIEVDFKITRGKSVKSADGMEVLRLFLLLFDPEMDDEGEVGDIMVPMIAFFKAFHAKRKVGK